MDFRIYLNVLKGDFTASWLKKSLKFIEVATTLENTYREVGVNKVLITKTPAGVSFRVRVPDVKRKFETTKMLLDMYDTENIEPAREMIESYVELVKRMQNKQSQGFLKLGEYLYSINEDYPEISIEIHSGQPLQGNKKKVPAFDNPLMRDYFQGSISIDLHSTATTARDSLKAWFNKISGYEYSESDNVTDTLRGRLDGIFSMFCSLPDVQVFVGDQQVK